MREENAPAILRTGPPLKRSNINLLICLDALLATQSVSRAAERLDMSQPGMSNALSRLRDLTGDPLLIRSGNEFRLSDRAAVIARKVRYGVELMDEIFANEGPVDMAKIEATVTLAVTDSLSVHYLPPLTRILAAEAPNVELVVRPPDPLHLKEWLSEGECDIALGYFRGIHPDLLCARLYAQPLACITSRGSCASLTMDEYLRRRHVVLGSPHSPHSTLEQALTESLVDEGHERNRPIRVPSALLIPHIVAGSDYVATLPHATCTEFAAELPLDVWPLPFPMEPLETVMVWHARTHRQAVFTWLRERIKAIAPPV